MAPSKWSVKSITATSSNMDGPQLGVGNEFHVTFKLAYEKSPKDPFEEMPRLNWQEEVTLVDHTQKEWWTFRGNLYDHNPTSNTLKVWTQRYIIAYNTAMGPNSCLLGPGSCTLYETGLLGSKRVSKLPVVDNNEAKANAVREHLRTKGGRLEIVIVDRPALKTRDTAERLLQFTDVGVILPGSVKWNGYQRLVLENKALKTRDASCDRKGDNLKLKIPAGYKQKGHPYGAPKKAGEVLLGQGEVWSPA